MSSTKQATPGADKSAAVKAAPAPAPPVTDLGTGSVLVSLQQRLGNQGLAAFLRARPPRLQLRAEAGPGNDPWEREAEQLAAAMVEHRQGPPPDPAAGASPAGRGGEQKGRLPTEGTIQLRALRTPEPVARAPFMVSPAPASLAETNDLVRRLGPGHPLEAAARRRMEGGFGHDLSAVRVHTDTRAAAAAGGLGAQAFTVGVHVAFGAGRYAPGTPRGDHLLAHELAHVVQQTGGGGGLSRAPTMVQRNGDGQASPQPAPPEPIRPQGTDARRLREEAAGLLRTLLSAGTADQERVRAELAVATYLIVGNRLTWYRADGSLIRAFPVASGARMWAAGFYYRTPDDQLRRYVRIAGTPVWAPWVFPNARVGHILNWLSPADRPAFGQIVQGYGGAPVFIVIPADPNATRRDSRAAERLVERVRTRLASRTGSSPASAAAPQPGAAAPQPGTAAATAQTVPQQQTGAPPDRVVVWSNEHGVYANVWVDRAVASVEVDEGESEAALEERVQRAADDLRRSRDPAQSERIADGATTTGFQGESRPAPTPSLAGSQRIANAPAYTASIKNHGPEVTVPGAVTRFAMALDFAPAGRDLLSQVTARMQPINYYWELLDVTGLSPESQAAASHRRVGSGQQATHAQATGRDIAAEGERVVEDTTNDLGDLAASRMPLQAKATWLQVIGISNVVRMVGAPISSFVSLVAQPLNEQRIAWSREGDFLVRCVATPSHGEDAVIIRASSVATALVRVESIRRRAASVTDRTDTEIARLEAERARATTDADRAALDRQLEALRRTLTSTTGELGASALRAVNERLAVAEELHAANAAGTRRPERSPAIRLLAVQLELQGIALADYLESLRSQKQELESRLARTGEVVGRMPRGNFHPRVTLVSEETGQANELIIVLGEAADSSEAGRHYLLADVTVPNPRERYVYEGRSSRAGLAGHSEAIRAAFVDFRENNGYGRGTIAIRLPTTLATAVGGAVTLEQEMRSAPGTRGRVMQRLRDLATAAEVAGLFLTGPAGLAVGAIGGVAGAIVAVDSIRRRQGGTDFRWASFETIMDISSIVGGAAGFAGVGVLPLRSLPRWTSRVERLQGMLHIFGVGQMASQVVVIPVQLELQLQEIDRTPGLSEGERAARRAEAFLQAVRAALVTTVSAAQMMDTSHGLESPRRATDLSTAPRTAELPPVAGEHGSGGTGRPAGETAARTERPGTPDRPGSAPDQPPVAGERAPVPQAPPPAARTARVVALETAMGDLQGQVPVVETSTLRGRSTRVTVRDGAVVMEVGPEAGPAQIRSHLETARVLRGYQGPLGAVRRLLSRVVQVLTRIPGYGTRGFESRLEVRKLRQILDTLEQTQAAIERRFAALGEREGAPTTADRAAIQRDIETIEYQLRYHERLVDSLDPGSGYVAAYDRSTLARYPAQAGELAAIEAALRASGDNTLVQHIDRVAELEQQGRVAGLGDWIREAGAAAGDRGRLNTRMRELANALREAEAASAGDRVRLQADTSGRFTSVTETRATGARPTGTNELRMRGWFTDPADTAAFDAYAARRYESSDSRTTFDADLSRTPRPVVEREVRLERARQAERARLARHAATLADPLHPELARTVAPGTEGNGDVWLHYETRFDANELAQAQRLRAATAEEIHLFGDNALHTDFPGIDGTIGNPRRPMQLKRIGPADGASGGRLKAQEALAAALPRGFAGVEVYIEAPGFSRAEIAAAWNDPIVGRTPASRGPTPGGPVFSGDTIALIEVSCSDGRMRVRLTISGYEFQPL